jgi:hypothetical protein
LTEYDINLILPLGFNQSGASLVPTLLAADIFVFFAARSACAKLRFSQLSFVVLRSTVWLDPGELLFNCDQKVAAAQEILA